MLAIFFRNAFAIGCGTHADGEHQQAGEPSIAWADHLVFAKYCIDVRRGIKKGIQNLAESDVGFVS